jgi:hypothetical protein
MFLFLPTLILPFKVKDQAHRSDDVPGSVSESLATGRWLLAGVFFTEWIADVIGLDNRLCDLRELFLGTDW